MIIMPADFTALGQSLSTLTTEWILICLAFIIVLLFGLAASIFKRTK